MNYTELLSKIQHDVSIKLAKDPSFLLLTESIESAIYGKVSSVELLDILKSIPKVIEDSFDTRCIRLYDALASAVIRHLFRHMSAWTKDHLTTPDGIKPNIVIL